MRTGAFKIALVYIVMGILWITLSDRVLLALQSTFGAEQVFFLGSIKGIVYVLITGVLLYYLIVRHTRRLSESERKYRTYFDQNTNPMWIINRRTMLITAVNDAATARYGYTKEEFLKMSALDLRPPEEINAAIMIFHDLTKGINDIGVVKHVKKDGTIIKVHITCNLIDSARESLVMAMAVVENQAK
ncbi:PAS domain S-box protein [Mucilaginibacter sp. 14171R-50]|uniref:PAS domain S-box protein n=1 Tax=Mucilaginibacter sp. 14171R-50 TaxID=2703789 RepID=UPI00138C8525|nr:PAS domain S-box protein [Mucilaginibacter sp. 14171R-50]QHS54341.1 PAS domain S-box protein [Mucilaginibacter sp. 14171R-50]